MLEPGQLPRIQAAVAAVAVAEPVQDYLVTLGEKSRHHREITLGVSPRGLLTWQRAAQAQAWLDGRDFVTPDDIQQVAAPVLSVRLGIDRADAHDVINDLLRSVAVPTGQTMHATKRGAL
jgi:MoxR-like ATPase